MNDEFDPDESMPDPYEDDSPQYDPAAETWAYEYPKGDEPLPSFEVPDEYKLPIPSEKSEEASEQEQPERPPPMPTETARSLEDLPTFPVDLPNLSPAQESGSPFVTPSPLPPETEDFVPGSGIVDTREASSTDEETPAQPHAPITDEEMEAQQFSSAGASGAATVPNADTEASPPLTSPEATETMPKKKRGRRGCLLVLLLLVAGLVWLFWPVAPPKRSLLAYLPGRTAAAELRSPGRILDFALADADGLGAILAQPQTVELLDAAGLPDPQEEVRRSLESTGMPAWVVSFLAYRVEAVAFGKSDAQGTSPRVLAKLDNAGRVAVRLALLLRGRELGGLTVLQTGNKQYLTLLSGEETLLVGAESREALREMDAVLSEPDAPVDPTPPHTGVLLRFPGEADGPLRNNLLTISRADSAFGLRFSAEVNPDIIERLPEEASPPTSPFSVASSADLSVSGWVAPQLAGRLLRRAFFGETEKPTRGADSPYLVVLWSFLAEGIGRHADGRFLFALAPPPPVKNDYAVPVMPELALAWGMEDKAGNAAAFAEELRKLLAFLRAPGGPAMLQAVREEIRLAPEENAYGVSGSVRLQPLFFHHMTLRYRLQDGVGFLGTAGREELRPGLSLETRDDPANLLLDARLTWRRNEETIAALMAVLEDKALKHGWAPVDARATVARRLAVIEAALVLFARADGRVRLHEKSGDAPRSRLEVNLLLTPLGLDEARP